MGIENMDIKQYVISLLEGYNAMKQETETLRFELKNLKFEDEGELIEAMSLSSPGGEYISGGGVSDKTANIALNYARKRETLREQAAREMITRLHWLDATVDRLDFYIDKLEAHQASILRDYYFEGYTWRELQDLRGVTDKTLMKHRDNAVKALTMTYSSLNRIGLL